MPKRREYLEQLAQLNVGKLMSVKEQRVVKIKNDFYFGFRKSESEYEIMSFDNEVLSSGNTLENAMAGI